MKHFPVCLLLAALTLCATASRAEIFVVTGHNIGAEATPAFKFPHLPSPAQTGTPGQFTIVDGVIDRNGGGLEKLNDGRLPADEDQHDENFFFGPATAGGRLRLDLDQVKTIQQINTYSWHPGTRGPQVYKVYGASGAEAGFDLAPKHGADPAACGWTLIAAVDTRPVNGNPGGQYGVSISNSTGPVGDYRYLLFDCSSTEMNDQFGNTFYSEINVLSPAEVAAAISSTAAGALQAARAAARQHAITVFSSHVNNADATPAFTLPRLPQPSQTGTEGKFAVIDGAVDGFSGGVAKLNDGRLPANEDQPAENFFFRSGTDGGRLRLDLYHVKTIQQINTYSWHKSWRAPQVYKVYGATGEEAGFKSRPDHGTDPATCGWTLIASVNTRPINGDPGGQYGVSISDASGALGDYRFLLFDCSRTEMDDQFGNTFYSEINVLGPADAAAAGSSAAETLDESKWYVARTADGKYEIAIDASRAPELGNWAANQLAPALVEWYPRIVALLPGPGFQAPSRISVILQPGQGQAETRGSRITASSTWLKQESNPQALGSLVHEAVHLVQQYEAGRRLNPHPAENPDYLVEGIADYIRWFKYDPQSKGAEITRPDLAEANYDRGSRITANFLNWVSEKYDPDLIAELNAAMREGKYSTNLWPKATGETVEQLNSEWKDDLKKKLATTTAGGG